MYKAFETKTKIIVRQPTKNILLKLWRQLTKKHGVVYTPSLEEARVPSNILNKLVHASCVLGIPLPQGIDRLLSSHYTTEEKRLPKSKGGWHIMTFLDKSPKGVIVLAKILTRQEDDYIHEVLYLQTPDNFCCTHQRVSAHTNSYSCYPYQ
ncbi:MAG: hypothetical protein J6V30_06910 [Paludibacteraceae bacterium]|nr:hypothetical protein [Paludibacteraceae bacterium]